MTRKYYNYGGEMEKPKCTTLLKEEILQLDVHGLGRDPVYSHYVPVARNTPIPKGYRVVRYCQSKGFQMVPGCTDSFYRCEMERFYGTVKHLQGQHWYDRAKKGTSITCKEMPLEDCPKLIIEEE